MWIKLSVPLHPFCQFADHQFIIRNPIIKAEVCTHKRFVELSAYNLINRECIISEISVENYYNNNELINNLEEKILGQSNQVLSPDKRLELMEEKLFGAVQSGDVESRLKSVQIASDNVNKNVNYADNNRVIDVICSKEYLHEVKEILRSYGIEINKGKKI